jgi:predicted HicB family RNase H-like nuclease
MSLDHYTYRVTWSPEDGEHVGLCIEFPSLSWLAETPEEALAGIRQVVAEVIADLKASGESVPVPLAEKRYSGEFRVRIPPELHRQLALMAAEQGVSLNRLASAKLAGLVING